MKKRPIRMRLSKRAYMLVRWLVRTLSLLLVLLVCAFVFLRLYGVPKPILRALVSRANDAGIPIDVGHVMLTLKGWRAADVSFYGSHPDDLEPLFTAKEVLLARRIIVDGGDGNGWELDIEVFDLGINPSVSWGVEIPGDSPCRRVENVRLTLGIVPGRIEIRDAKALWLGVDIEVDGLVRLPDALSKGDPRQHSMPAQVYVTEEEFRAWEHHLKAVALNGHAALRVQFDLDLVDFPESRAELELDVHDVAFRNVGFSLLNMEARYDEQRVTLDRFEVRKDTKALELSGEYDLSSNVLTAVARNAITSNDLLLIVPQPILDVLVNAELLIGEIPRFHATVGPTSPGGVLNAVAGDFSVADVSYRGLEIKTLRGDFSRANHRLDLTNLQGETRGQEWRADEVGSSMKGGKATGEVYWDLAAHSFGVSASGRMDPNLFLRPLDIVFEATNAINRFKFLAEPPDIQIELGACYTNWPDFFLNIQARGNEVRLHEAELSSLSASAYYQHAILELDPIAAMKGVDFMKGSGTIFFKKGMVEFDAFGSMPPDIVEKGVYPDMRLFSNHIHAEGETRIKAQGRIEWKTMRETDFTAEVEADRLRIPVAQTDAFSAVVRGKGPLISVEDAAFGIYEGTGEAEFSIRLDPATNAMPYDMDITVNGALFGECLKHVRESVKDRVGGRLDGHVQFAADMGEDFFSTANGAGSVSVVEGRLADLPFFSGFTHLMRRVIPGFNVFTITKVRGDFTLKDGSIHSNNAYFEGDVISAKAQGSYSAQKGFDARVQAQVLRDNRVARLFRAITDPLFKLFEMRLTGTLDNPQWRLDNFTPANSVMDDPE